MLGLSVWPSVHWNPVFEEEGETRRKANLEPFTTDNPKSDSLAQLVHFS